MTTQTKIFLLGWCFLCGTYLSAQVKTNVQTAIPELEQAKKGFGLLKSIGDTTVEASQVGDTLVAVAQDSVMERLGPYEAEIKQLRQEIADYTTALSETNPDTLLIGMASDSIEARLNQPPEARQLRQLAARYSSLFKRKDKERKRKLKALKAERRSTKKAEMKATREDSLLAIRIRRNEIEITITEITQEQDSADALLKVLKKEFLDSAEIASLASEFAPKELADAQAELARMTATTDPQTLLTGQQPAPPSLPATPSAEPPLAPPPLPKYNTLATDLMDPEAFTTGKFKDKQHLLDQGHGQLSELKEKYTKVPNSNDLNTAVKKNSLQEEPLHKRLFFTGTNNLQITKSFLAVEFNGQFGYQFNRVWRAGVGGSLNTEWYADKPYARWQEGHPFSWHLFGQYTFFKSYVAHIEFEPVKTPQGGETPSQMRHKLLVGVGKIFALPKLDNVDGVVLLLYDTTSGEQFANRFKVRFGVNISL